MSDPIYEPPKTDSDDLVNRDSDEEREEVNKWSIRKLLFLTFLPFLTAILIGAAVRFGPVDIEFLVMWSIIILPLMGLAIALSTAFYFSSKQGDSIGGLIAHMILWVGVHAGLVCLGVFGACSIMQPFIMW